MDSDDLDNDSFDGEKFSDIKPLDMSRFMLKRKIGHGGFSIAYLIQKKETDELYAAKFFSIKDVIMMKFFYKEVEINNHASKLNSPFILKYVGYNLYGIENKTTPAIVTEYAPNGTLYKLLENEKKGIAPIEWNSTKKLMIIYGIARGMAILHANKIVHRDLKPGNVFLDEFLLPKIGDFGLSIYEDELLSQYNPESVGTPYYMPPEVIESRNCTKALDVYSFAITVYELITGKTPYDNKINQFDLINKIITGYRPRIDCYIPKSYKNLIESCWSTNPDDRPTFEEIVELLKTDKGFITESVNEKEFLYFINNYELDASEVPISKEDGSKIKKDSEKKDTKSDEISDFFFKKVHVEYPETTELLIDIDPIKLSLFEKFNYIGRGQYGKVFKVREKKTGEYFASKINLKTLNFCEPNEITNLKREINILSKLKSPAILRFIGYNVNNFKKKPKPTIITEFSKNGSLDQIIKLQICGLKPKEWTDTKVLITAYGIAAGMSYLHLKNILHRDLKPANVFFDDYLFPKIGDFGFSKEMDAEVPGFISPYQNGTPAFMSPEILNDSRYCKASDVYAYAILLYQMITLEEPYKDVNVYKLGQYVQEGNRPHFNTLIPDCYKKLIEKCWADKAEERPTFDEILYHFENDDEFITDDVDEDEFFDYINYVKSQKINESFEKVTVDFEELKRIQENDPTLTVSFLDLDQFDRVQILKRLDNFKIYEIVNKITDQHYEAKISTIKITLLSKKEIIHLQREINILSKLDHPSFLKFIGYSPIDFNQEPNPIIVTEMPPNRSLNDLLDVERSNEHIKEWNDTKKLISIYGIASGMSYLHHYNVIH